jgi:hypothetical protein
MNATFTFPTCNTSADELADLITCLIACRGQWRDKGHSVSAFARIAFDKYDGQYITLVSVFVHDVPDASEELLGDIGTSFYDVVCLHYDTTMAKRNQRHAGQKSGGGKNNKVADSGGPSTAKPDNRRGADTPKAWKQVGAQSVTRDKNRE